jgi:hypothetical protein
MHKPATEGTSEQEIMTEVTAKPIRTPDDVTPGDVASHPEGEKEFVSSFDSMRLDSTPDVQRGPIYGMPNELLSEILSNVPDLRSARQVNRSFGDLVRTDPHLARRYRLAPVVARTVQRLEQNNRSGSPDQLFARSMLAEETAHQLRSNGVLNREHPRFHQAMRELEPHYPFLPRPEDVPAGLFHNEATRPVTSSDIGEVVDAVFNEPRDDANVQTLTEIFGYLSPAQKKMSLMVCHPNK